MLDTHPEQVKNAKLWIASHAHIRKTLNRRITSYGLKHLAERYANSYITNHSMVQAMLESGYRAKQIGGSPNYFFNVKFKEV